MAESLHSDTIDNDHFMPEILAVFDGRRFDWVVLTRIFSFLDLQSKGRVAQVSSTWRNVAYQQSLWYDVEVTLICGRDPDIGYVAILPPRFNGYDLEIVSFSLGIYNGRCIPNLTPITAQEGKHHLTNFKFCQGITDVGVKLACNCFKNMRSVTIPEGIMEGTMNSHITKRVSITDAGFKILAGMKHLEKLVIKGGLDLTDDAMYCLAASASLRVLHLDGCHKIGDGGMKLLAERGSKIVEFSAFCSPMTNDGCLHLAKLECLKVIRLIASSIDDAGIAHLAANTDSRITCLTLDSCSGITDDALVHLAKMKNLRELEFERCEVGDLGLAHLATGGSMITKLTLYYDEEDDADRRLFEDDDGAPPHTYMTDGGFIHLANLAQLKCLKIIGLGVTCQGLHQLSDGTAKIVSLDVSGCDNIDAEALTIISLNFPAMRELCLSVHQITDQGLALAALKLCRLESLTEIDYHTHRVLNIFDKILKLRDVNGAVPE